MPKERRRFAAEFNKGAVSFVIDPRCLVAEIARDIGVNSGTLGNWVQKTRHSHAPGAHSESEREELVRFGKEVKEVAIQRDVLKRSVAFWVDETTRGGIGSSLPS